MLYRVLSATINGRVMSKLVDNELYISGAYDLQDFFPDSARNLEDHGLVEINQVGNSDVMRHLEEEYKG